MVKIKRSPFSPIIPLLFVAFILTSFVALRRENAYSNVLGEEIENSAPVTEIRDVSLGEVKTKLENVVNANKNRRAVEFKNENGRVRVNVQSHNEDGSKLIHNTLELKIEESDLNLKIREATAPGAAGGVEKKVRVTPIGEEDLKIEDGDHEVKTNFPISVNESENTISVTTPNREVKVRELPSTAIKNLLDSELFTSVNQTEIKQSEDGETDAVLSVFGENRVKLFGIIPISAPVTAEIDTETGVIKSLGRPWYLSAFGFLFNN